MFDIKELIRNDIAFIDHHCRLAEAARLLCVSDQLVLPVVNECFEPVGMLTERDVLAWLCSGKDRNARVADYVRTEFTTIDDRAGLVDVICIFAGENHREILIVSDGVLAGLIKRGNLIKYLIDKGHLQADLSAEDGQPEKMKSGV